MPRELVDIEGLELKHETELAYLFDNGKVEAWIPKSRCEWDMDTRTLTLPMNLAIDKELV